MSAADTIAAILYGMTEPNINAGQINVHYEPDGVTYIDIDSPIMQFAPDFGKSVRKVIANSTTMTSRMMLENMPLMVAPDASSMRIMIKPARGGDVDLTNHIEDIDVGAARKALKSYVAMGGQAKVSIQLSEGDVHRGRGDDGNRRN